MRKLAAIITLFLSPLIFAQTADEFISPELGCRFAVPDGWIIDNAYYDQIILSDSQNSRAAVTIKKYVLESNNLIKSNSGLITAITGLYDKLGIKISKSDEIDYTVSKSKAIFQTSWTHFEKSDQTTYKKYVMGTLGRLPDGNQVLYLIITEAPEENYEIVHPQLGRVLSSFQITEQFYNKLYPKQNLMTYLFILFIFILIAFFFARNRRIQKSRNPLGKDSSSFWRCTSCGRVNHVELKYCNRCGRERVAVNSLKK